MSENLIKRLAAAKWAGALDGATSREDVEQDAALRIWEASLRGETLTAAEAVDGAYNAAREAQTGSGAKRSRAVIGYLSQAVEGVDGLTFADVVEAPEVEEVDQSAPTLRERVEEGAALSTLLAARRIVEGSAAHGALAARRGAVGSVVGAEHDALLAEGLDAVGGFHYGYGAKLLRWLDGRGVTMSANTLYQWADRYKRRVIRENHSSRD
jgi:hypothetical protein